MLYNSHAGHGRAKKPLAKVLTEFETKGIDIDVRLTDFPSYGSEIIQELDFSLYDGIVACGRDGNSIVILPEGHRTLDGKLGEFKKMSFFFTKQAAVDLAPIGMSGLFHLKRKGNWHIQPTTVKIKFGNIITAEEIASMSVAELRDRTRAEIESLIERS